MRTTPNPDSSVAAADRPPPSACEWAAMITGALVVAGGVLFFDWPAFAVLALFWIENVVVGVANWLRLLLIGLRLQLRDVFHTFVLLAFFPVHYGMFCFGHAELLVSIFGDGYGPTGVDAAPFRLVEVALAEPLGWTALAAIAVVVALDTVRWWHGKRGRFVPDDLGHTMFAPYPRIVVLHVTLILGGFLLAASAAPASMVLVLVALKFAVDVHMARRPREFGLGRARVTPVSP
jgi:hypothetical protein